MGPVTRGRKKNSDLPIHETVSDTGGCCTRKAVESSSKFPYFVKCIKASNVGRSSHLSIPGDFAKTHLPRRRTNAILWNSKGSWIVGLDLGRERSTIRAGWINFVRDNMIRKGDTCIFELVGERGMRVHVFHERKIQSISSKSPVSSVCPCWSEACEADPSIDLVSHEKAKIENAHLPIDEMDSHTRGCLSKGQMRTEGRERVRRTAQSFTSDFPYFKWCMREYNVGGRRLILHIPNYFSKEHFRGYGKNMKILLHNRGRSWEMNLLVSRRQYSISRGWASFVRHNNIQKGDICAFELVGKTDMRVRIFRVDKKVKFVDNGSSSEERHIHKKHLCGTTITLN